MPGDPKSEEYLSKCFEAWMTVFDSYDQLLRTFRSMSPNLSEDLAKSLNELKRHIEDKRMDLEQIHEQSLHLVRSEGRNVQETPPLASKIDFNVAKYLKSAWPTVSSSPRRERSPSPFETASSSIAPPGPPADTQVKPEVATVTTNGPPPGFDRIMSWVQTVDTAPPPKKPESKPIPVVDDDDEFEDFDGTAPGTLTSVANFSAPEPPVKKEILNDFDDFEPFGETVVPPRCVSAPIPPSKPQPLAQQIRLPNGNPATVLETMRCVDFLANKIKQKYGVNFDAALSKVYGHLSEEKQYRVLIGGLKEFPEFLTRFPDYFKLSADQQSVQLVPNAVKKSLEAVRLAKKLAEEAAKLRLKQRRDSESPETPPRSKAPVSSVQMVQNPVVNVKPTQPSKPRNVGPAVSQPKRSNLMDLDDYGSSGDGSSVGAQVDDLSDNDDDDSNSENRIDNWQKLKASQVPRQLNNKK